LRAHNSARLAPGSEAAYGSRYYEVGGESVREEDFFYAFSFAPELSAEVHLQRQAE